MQKTQVQSLRQEDTLEESMVIHSSIHAWRIPGTFGPGELQSMGVSHSQKQLKWLSTQACRCIIKSWKNTINFLYQNIFSKFMDWFLQILLVPPFCQRIYMNPALICTLVFPHALLTRCHLIKLAFRSNVFGLTLTLKLNCFLLLLDK